MTTVFVLGSAKGVDAWEKSKHIPKVILPITEDGYSTFDFQMQWFRKLGLPVRYVIGFGGELIREYALNKGYNNLTWVWDKNWDTKRCVARLMFELRNDYLYSEMPIIQVFGDAIWDSQTWNELLNCDADIVRVNNLFTLMKFSFNGLRAMLNAYKPFDDLGIDGMFYRARANGGIKIAQVQGGYIFDFDREEDRLQSKGALEWLKEKELSK